MYQNRFSHEQPLAGLYDDLRTQLALETAEGTKVMLKDLRVDLQANQLEVAGRQYALGERAKSVLCERLKIGRVFDVVSEGTLNAVLADVHAGLELSDSSLVLKIRGNEVQGIVTERYNDTPYLSLLQMLEHIGARPIRVVQNNQLLRMQLIFEEKYGLSPTDGKRLNLGVEVNTSDMGVGALKFNVFLYRWICANGMIMGRSAVGNFRTVHINSMDQAEIDVQKELDRVLSVAQKAVSNLVEVLIKTPYDSGKVVDYLGQRLIGQKPMALIVSKIVTARPAHMWDVVNVLTAAGHDPSFSQSIQHVLETTAGKMMVAA